MRVRQGILLMSALISLSAAAFAQGADVRAGDGWTVTTPKSLSSVRFKQYRREYTLEEVEQKWEELDRENLIRQMGVVSHEKVVEFLYKVAIVDSSLYKKRRPTATTFGEWAIQNMVRTRHPSVRSKLEAILKAELEGIDPAEVRKTKGKAAVELLRFGSGNKALAYRVLDENAASGDVRCPYPYPIGGYWRGPKTEQWVDPPVEDDAKALLRKWLSSEHRTGRLEGALCMAQAGITDERIRPLAEAELAKPIPEGKITRERHLAEQILKMLSVHGDKEAARQSDRIETEREIKRLSTGHPEADKNVREHFEKEFRKRWEK